jgi:hypothetical protein
MHRTAAVKKMLKATHRKADISMVFLDQTVNFVLTFTDLILEE